MQFQFRVQVACALRTRALVAAGDDQFIASTYPSTFGDAGPVVVGCAKRSDPLSSGRVVDALGHHAFAGYPSDLGIVHRDDPIAGPVQRMGEVIGLSQSS